MRPTAQAARRLTRLVAIAFGFGIFLTVFVEGATWIRAGWTGVVTTLMDGTAVESVIFCACIPLVMVVYVSLARHGMPGLFMLNPRVARRHSGAKPPGVWDRDLDA
jgi:hypothetical protein